MFSIMSMLNHTFKKRIKEKDFTARIKTKDGIGRWYTFKDGKVKSGADINSTAEVVVTYHDVETALMTMQTKVDVHRQINEVCNMVFIAFTFLIFGSAKNVRYFSVSIP